nr:MAG TPA: hypothetical protein [Ackermannviridae sp.]
MFVINIHTNFKFFQFHFSVTFQFVFQFGMVELYID